MKRRLSCWNLMAAPLLVCALGCLASGGCGRPSAEPSQTEQAGGRSTFADAPEGPAAASIADSSGSVPAVGKQDRQSATAAGGGLADRTGVADGSSSGASSSVPPAVDPALRTLVAGYLESDGQGAFRPREEAATALEKLPSEQVDMLWTLLSDREVQVRRGAAFFLLGQFDPQQPRHIQAFAALLNDPDRTIRGLALAALRQCSRSHQREQLGRVVPLLDPAREEHAEHRAAVARWLGQLREDAQAALPALTSAVRADPDPRVRGAALVSVSQVAPIPAALPVLVEALDDREPSVRLVAAARLRQMDAAAALAADRLAARLADDDSRVAEAAASALLRIGPPAVPVLSRQLSATQPAVRRLALTVLAELGPAAAPARPHIESCLKDADPHVRKLAEAILARLPAR